MPWGRISYPGFKEVSIINWPISGFIIVPQCAGSGSITPTFVLAVERWSQQLSHENVNRTEASRHHVGYEVHALPTVFMEVEDSRQLSSLSFNILSDYWVMSSLPVVKHLQRSITLFTHLSSEGWLGPLLRSFVVPQKMSKTKAGWRNCGASLSPTNTLFHKTRDQSKSRSTNSESSLGRLKNM